MGKNWRWWLLAAVFLAGLLPVVSHPSTSTCQELYKTDNLITFNKKILKVQVATTEPQREKGLGGRACIGQDQGMLFVFDQSDHYPFWMAGMRFDIDMLWLDSDKKVVYIQSDISPDTYPRNFVNTQAAKYVLELKSGQADKDGIKTGSQLTF